MHTFNYHLFQIHFNIIPRPNRRLSNRLWSIGQKFCLQFSSYSSCYMTISVSVFWHSSCLVTSKSCKTCKSVLHEKELSCSVDNISNQMSLCSWSDVSTFETDTEFWLLLTLQRITDEVLWLLYQTHTSNSEVAVCIGAMCGNGLCSCMNCGWFVDQLGHFQLLKTTMLHILRC